ncbi:DUF4160 domain-containing protein [Gammaproteobacteria bacterium]
MFILGMVKWIHYNGIVDSTVYRFKNARLAMFFGDHPPAHVHLLGPGFNVSIDVETLKTKGNGDAKTIAEAKTWISDNKAAVMAIWIERGTKR